MTDCEKSVPDGQIGSKFGQNVSSDTKSSSLTESVIVTALTPGRASWPALITGRASFRLRPDHTSLTPTASPV